MVLTILSNTTGKALGMVTMTVKEYDYHRKATERVHGVCALWELPGKVTVPVTINPGALVVLE